MKRKTNKSCYYLSLPYFVWNSACFCVDFYIKFRIKEFFSKYNQIHSFLRILLHLLKKSLMHNFTFCAVNQPKLDKTIDTCFNIKTSKINIWFCVCFIQFSKNSFLK